MQHFVYIMASKPNGIIYIGVTSDLMRRAYEHKNNLIEGFTQKYFVHRLVYYVSVDNPESAILREKQIKKWKRAWKVRLIEETNSSWRDLYYDLVN